MSDLIPTQPQVQDKAHAFRDAVMQIAVELRLNLNTTYCRVKALHVILNSAFWSQAQSYEDMGKAGQSVFQDKINLNEFLDIYKNTFGTNLADEDPDLAALVEHLHQINENGFVGLINIEYSVNRIREAMENQQRIESAGNTPLLENNL
jgi:hypothetical protein